MLFRMLTASATSIRYSSDILVFPESLHLTHTGTPGVHGFHVHQKPDCAAGMKDGKMVTGLAAGGHHDPSVAGKHEGPHGKGHLGNLPALTVGTDGKAVIAVSAPRLMMADVKGRSLMIHAGGDNYADQPAPLGGGARIACGVIE
jgi:Cu-Zn family superoxide dismutase